MYSIPPDDGLKICSKHVEIDWRNTLRINSASSWFSLQGCIEMHGQQNINKYIYICRKVCHYGITDNGTGLYRVLWISFVGIFAPTVHNHTSLI